MIITIDGPVASGKSSVAKDIAEKLKIYYLYTGLLYRAVASVLREQIKKEIGRKVFDKEFEDYVKHASDSVFDFIKDISYDYGEDKGVKRPYVFYKKDEITNLLYDVSLDQISSIVSANKHVRDALLPIQRDVAKRYDIVADGRDCGSVIFPNADHKFYLTASLDTRAMRLMMDERRGVGDTTIDKIKSELEERDRRDKERVVAPLVVPNGATIIDNSSMTLNETVAKFLEYIKERRPRV